MPKRDFLRNLERDLRRIDKRLVVEMSTSSDPYPPLERWMLLTRKALEKLVKYRVRVLITTKSNIVIRDIDLLLKTPSAVMVTITSIDDNLAKRIEPGAPPPSKRIEAVEVLAKNNIPVGVRIDPIIPGLNDDPDMISELVAIVAGKGAKHIVTSTYKARPDNFSRMIEEFPEYRDYWRRIYLEEGVRIHGYYYLKPSLRKRLLKPVVDNALRHGLTVATCREGFPEYFKAPSCDGQHLISYHSLRDRVVMDSSRYWINKD